jgi:DNA-binding NtrC family response regulator
MRPEKTETILCVDDQKEITASLRRLLERGGYRVFTANDARDALRQILHARVNLVLLDIRMPGLDGLFSLHLIKTRFPEMRVIMLTGNGSDENLFRSVSFGCDGFLEKPWDPPFLLSVVRSILHAEPVVPRDRTTPLQEE